MIKKYTHLKQILITVGLVLILNALSACSDAISQGNMTENEIHILQGQNTIKKSGNLTILSADVEPDAMTTMKPDSSVIPSVTVETDILTIELDDIKETPIPFIMRRMIQHLS